jgi:uncharacterized membrane protein
MPEENNNTDVPQELKESKEIKQSSEQKAEDALKSEIPRQDLVLSAVGYISFLCILPLVLRKESEYCQHHANQALVLAIGIYFLDAFNILPAGLASLYVMLKYAVILYSVYMALKGVRHKLPIIYDLSKKFEVTIKR